jgi:hypothetical protein
MFGFSRSSGLPERQHKAGEYEKLHERAKRNDAEAKDRMASEYNERMRVKEPVLKVGHKVLHKWVAQESSDLGSGSVRCNRGERKHGSSGEKW